jgi:hypothetical protein
MFYHQIDDDVSINYLAAEWAIDWAQPIVAEPKHSETPSFNVSLGISGFEHKLNWR